MLQFITDSGSDGNPWMPSVKYNHISVVSAIRMRMPELARQAMSEHVDAKSQLHGAFRQWGRPLPHAARQTAARHIKNIPGKAGGFAAKTAGRGELRSAVFALIIVI